MDQSAQPTQNPHAQGRFQAPTVQIPTAEPETNAKTDSPQTPKTISVNKEAGPAVIVQEAGNNEEVQIASQETKSQGSVGNEEIEVQPSAVEPKIDASVEHVVEKSADQEKPVLSESVKQAGVTHSGPGVIPDTAVKVGDNKFGVKELDVSYPQAVAEEKHTPFKSSKHWLMGIYEYVWRKINPNIGVKK